MTWPQVFSTGNDCMAIRKQRERQIRPAGFSRGSRGGDRPAFRRSKLQPFSVPKIWGTRVGDVTGHGAGNPCQAGHYEHTSRRNNRAST